MAENSIKDEPISIEEQDESLEQYLDFAMYLSLMKHIIKGGDLESMILLVDQCTDLSFILNQNFIDDGDDADDNDDEQDDDVECMTPLHFAVKNNQLEICKVLIGKGSDVNISSKCHSAAAPLHLSINKDVGGAILSLLIKEGANLEVNDKWNCTPLQLLFMEPGPERQFQFDKFKMLLDAGASVNTTAGYGSQPLHGSVKIFHSKECEDMHDSTEIPLCVQVTKMLIDKGADVNCVEDALQTPLHFAGDCDDVVKLLLDNGATAIPKDTNGMTPLLNIARHTSPALNDVYGNVERFLQKRIKSMELLLSFDAEINDVDSMGESGLHWLVSRPSITTSRMLKAFVRFGANINARTTRMETPMHYLCIAIRSEEDKDAATASVVEELVEEMIAYGADIEANDVNGYTPLASAILRSDSKVIEILLEQGASVNFVDKFGRTLYHLLETETIPNHIREMFQSPVVGGENTDAFGLKPCDYKDGSLHSVHVETQSELSEEATLCMLYDMLIAPVNQDVNVTEDVAKLKVQLKNLDEFCESKLHETGVGKVIITPALAMIQNEVDLLINRISQAVKQKDARMAFTPALSGSMSEETKIGNMDEFDYLLYMDVVSEMCDITEADSVIPGFAHIKAKENSTDEERKNIFRESDNALIANVFGSYLYQLIQEVLAKPEIWKSSHFYWEGGPLQVLTGASWVSNLVIKWAGKEHNGLTISVDLAPVIHSKHWKPNKVKERSKFLRVPTGVFGSLVVISKPAPEQQSFEGGNETYLRLSYSHVEKNIFLSLSEPAKTSYVLAKVLLSNRVWPLLKPEQIDGPVRISSYMLKMALFTLYEQELEAKDDKSSCRTEGIAEIRKRTAHMFSYIEKCIKKKRLPSYFLPEQNILEYHQRISFSDRVVCLVLAKLLE
eukprot:Seg631.3 transcript_id=Seg631.3/GoldUCD/mRNA.D3Y31 product="putative ankyrin repeat protein FPV162" protein_id=Seg631.3/GoldUCD/D3Y31